MMKRKTCLLLSSFIHTNKNSNQCSTHSTMYNNNKYANIVIIITVSQQQRTFRRGRRFAPQSSAGRGNPPPGLGLGLGYAIRSTRHHV